jgi:sulfur-carrier protein
MDLHPTQVDSAGGHVTLRYWASLRSAAGVAEDRIEVAGPVKLSELTGIALDLHAGTTRFAELLATCSVLVEDRPSSSADPAEVVVQRGETVEFLPPFAGG